MGLKYFEVTKWRWGGWFGNIPVGDPGGHSAVVIYPKGGSPANGMVLDNWWGTSSIYPKSSKPGGWAYSGTIRDAYGSFSDYMPW